MGYPSKWLSILIQFRGVGVKSCHLFLDNFLLEINNNQPKIAKSWGGLWRLGGGMVGNSRQPNNMGASWSYRFFFGGSNQREPRKKR